MIDARRQSRMLDQFKHGAAEIIGRSRCHDLFASHLDPSSGTGIGHPAIDEIAALGTGSRAAIKTAGADNNGALRRNGQGRMFTGQPRDAIHLQRRGPIILAIRRALAVAAKHIIATERHKPGPDLRGKRGKIANGNAINKKGLVRSLLA